MAYILIAAGVIAVLWLASRLRRGIAGHDAFFTQVKFIQMYMKDNTEKQFHNKDVDEAMAFGQEMLWSAAEEFNERMHKAVIEQQPIPIGDMGMLMASIKIIKAAESMVFIKKNGPIHEDVEQDDNEEVGSEGV